MPREDRIFQSVVDPVRTRTRQGASVLLTVLLEAVAIIVLVMVPLMATDVLPDPAEGIHAFVAAPNPPPPPPPPPPARASEPVRQPDPQPVTDVPLDAAPIEAPREIVPEPPVDIDFERGTVPGGSAVGVPNSIGVAGSQGDLLRPPPPRPPEPPQGPPHVGGNVLPPVKTKHVNPVYPPIAIASGTQAVVIVEATIDETGRVRDARILRGHTLLNEAALEAVRQWEFTPTLLNGRPTAVIMNVTVTFRLQ